MFTFVAVPYRITVTILPEIFWLNLVNLHSNNCVLLPSPVCTTHSLETHKPRCCLHNERFGEENINIAISSTRQQTVKHTQKELIIFFL